jgi:hypothetical protein
MRPSLVLAGVATAAAVLATAAACNPTITITATCRGDQPFITVDLGQAGPDYPDAPIHIAIGTPTDETAAVVADVMGDTSPGGGVSSTVSDPGEVPVVVTWADGTTTKRTATAPTCPAGGPR